MKTLWAMLADTGYLGLIASGLWLGKEWAWNLAVFLTWFKLCVVFFGIATAHQMDTPFRDEPPGWWRVVIVSAAAIAFAATGNFLLAAVRVVSGTFSAGLVHSVNQRLAAEGERRPS